MKSISTTLLILLFASAGLAQSPEKMSYQAVIRNSSNDLLINQMVGMQVSIIQGNVTGATVYAETHNATTNSNGLVGIEIGTGTAILNQFQNINWSNGPYFIKTETDPTGGTNYSITGTSQLLSVPYALHAKTADSITGNITENDPLFSNSIAFHISALDTAHWNNQTTDTQLDSAGIAALGYVAGAHTIDTNTQLDSTQIARFGYVAGPHPIDTQLDSADISALGYVAGPHFVDIDTINNFTLKVNNGIHSFFDISTTNEMYNATSKQIAIVGVSVDNHNPLDSNDTRALMVHNDGIRNLTKTVVCEPGELTIAVQNDSLGALNKNPFQAVIQMDDQEKYILIGNAYIKPEQQNMILVEGDETTFYFTDDSDTTYRAMQFTNEGFRIAKNDTVILSTEIDGTTTINDVLNITPRPAAPSNPKKGTMYFDAITNKLMVYDGTVWQACW